ncbi:flagellar basal body P-ring formation chaperone FlgA [Pontibacter sp. JAM-7]|uniref:flagellar basal body P-ring formation chaperone FlgA n=1 Tax=Pontibacter sp. JAM-7 TaxID=3366581 RepID=UPI003AF831F8
MKHLRLICLSALIPLLSASEFCSAALSAIELESLAKQHLLQHYRNLTPDARIEVKISPINRAVKLKKCSRPVHFGTPRGNGHRISLKAFCPMPFWQLYVAAEVYLYAPVVITRKSLPRNSALSAANVMLKEADITNQSSYFSDIATLNGWSTKRSLAAETVLTADMLKQPVAIQRNDAVLIEAKRQHVSIRVPGTALEDGAVGEQIRVRNDQSGIEIKGIITAPGQVRVP